MTNWHYGYDPVPAEYFDGPPGAYPGMFTPRGEREIEMNEPQFKIGDAVHFKGANEFPPLDGIITEVCLITPETMKPYYRVKMNVINDDCWSMIESHECGFESR